MPIVINILCLRQWAYGQVVVLHGHKIVSWGPADFVLWWCSISKRSRVIEVWAYNCENTINKPFWKFRFWPIPARPREILPPYAKIFWEKKVKNGRKSRILPQPARSGNFTSYKLVYFEDSIFANVKPPRSIVLPRASTPARPPLLEISFWPIPARPREILLLGAKNFEKNPKNGRKTAQNRRKSRILPQPARPPSYPRGPRICWPNHPFFGSFWSKWPIHRYPSLRVRDPPPPSLAVRPQGSLS